MSASASSNQVKALDRHRKSHGSIDGPARHAIAESSRHQHRADEQITMTVTTLVTQAPPSGNLVIVGKQEASVNHDVRDPHQPRYGTQLPDVV